VVNEHRLDVLRIAYWDHRKLAKLYKLDPKLHGVCFFGLASSMASFLEDSLVQPIMDGLGSEDLAMKFSGLVQNATAPLAGGLPPEVISIYKSENLLDPVFASSKYSVPVQIADVVSYLLHVRDFEALGLPLMAFKARLLEISKKLDPSLVVGAAPIRPKIQTQP
jgi:hypothetical protein